MNRFTKLALGVVAALAVSPAFADVDPLNGTNPTDLVIMVNDYHGATLTSTYAYEMNQSVAALFGTLVSNASLSTVNSISDTIVQNDNLTSFLSDSAGTYTFSVQGFDAPGQGGVGISFAPGKVPGAYVSVFTTTTGGTAIKNLLATAYTGKFQNAQNQFAAGAGYVADVLSGAGTDSTAYTAADWTLATQGMGGFSKGVSDWVGANTTTQLFGYTGNGSGAFLQSYVFGTVKLDLANKQIVFAGNPTSTVPVPGAVWLLGSGLLGLVGVSRRRAA